jgi:DNA-3-methyladenine glycosylase I
MSGKSEMPQKKRCRWVTSDPLYLRYHDKEWGVPVHNDRKLFEFISLEGAQAGLSWITILQKRENYRKAFSNFEAKVVARYSARKVAQILKNPGIVRNRLKVASTVTNAKAFLAVQKEFGSFNRYIWQFAGTRDPHAASVKMSKDLLNRGFRFVGPTICYAFMQACGLVQDHERNCFRSKEI